MDDEKDQGYLILDAEKPYWDFPIEIISASHGLHQRYLRACYNAKFAVELKQGGSGEVPPMAVPCIPSHI